MARQALIPGGAYANETTTRQRLVPGSAFLNETVAPFSLLQPLPPLGALRSVALLTWLNILGPLMDVVVAVPFIPVDFANPSYPTFQRTLLTWISSGQLTPPVTVGAMTLPVHRWKRRMGG
jgi:hypothetical protein